LNQQQPADNSSLDCICLSGDEVEEQNKSDNKESKKMTENAKISTKWQIGKKRDEFEEEVDDYDLNYERFVDFDDSDASLRLHHSFYDRDDQEMSPDDNDDADKEEEEEEEDEQEEHEMRMLENAQPGESNNHSDHNYVHINNDELVEGGAAPHHIRLFANKKKRNRANRAHLGPKKAGHFENLDDKLYYDNDEEDDGDLEDDGVDFHEQYEVDDADAEENVRHRNVGGGARFKLNISNSLYSKGALQRATVRSSSSEPNSPQAVLSQGPGNRKFTDEVRAELERHFRQDHFIKGIEKQRLARNLGLTERQVGKWFVHRREKLRMNNSAPVDTLASSSSARLLEDNYLEREEEVACNVTVAELGENEDQANISPIRQRTLLRRASLLERQKAREQMAQRKLEEHQRTLEQKRQMRTQKERPNATVESSDQEPTHNHHQQQQQPQHQPRSGGRGFEQSVVKCLEVQYEKTIYPEEEDVKQLCSQTGLSYTQVKSWFKQRRHKQKQMLNASAVSASQHTNKTNGTAAVETINQTISAIEHSEEIRDELEKAYQNKMSIEDRKQLAIRLNLEPMQLERWMYYRRRKENHK
jgi:hypothetical protein